ncbi:MAG: potassium-transporting ATPase subunit KdpB, partial [Phycisphaerae bacterium]|nr:potassium-transporting ATPase subunit KdpB [Phycisphaerae bacterium]
MSKHNKARPLFDLAIVRPAIVESFKKLHPVHMWKNPVMFVTEVGAALTTLDLFYANRSAIPFVAQVCIWLWFTVVFANFAEAMAEGRGKAQADALRKSRTKTSARKLDSSGTQESIVSAESLRKDDLFVCEANDLIPADGEIIDGAASVNESAITGESAPVIREAGGDRSAVTGGTTVLSDRIVVRVTANPGESFMDRMIGLIEGAKRQKTPNEIALSILLGALTIVFIVVCVTMMPFASYTKTFLSDADYAKVNGAVTITVLVALLVCLIPTTIGGLLSAIGIAGIDRMVQHNVLAMSGRAVEAAGDIDVLLLDKTGTITIGNRQASEFIPAPGVPIEELAEAAQLSSLADETPEGRSIVTLAEERYGRQTLSMNQMVDARFVPFTAQTRMSGLDVNGDNYRKGAAASVRAYVAEAGVSFPSEIDTAVETVSRSGGTPLVVSTRKRALGVVHLKDIVKAGLPDRFARFRAMGIKTVMITGDNPLTAAAIAKEAGVDDFLAQAKPEDKLALLRNEQAAGHLVAMTGDGTNDAPALAQADVGVAMNTGTQAAKE